MRQTDWRERQVVDAKEVEPVGIFIELPAPMLR